MARTKPPPLNKKGGPPTKIYLQQNTTTTAAASSMTTRGNANKSTTVAKKSTTAKKAAPKAAPGTIVKHRPTTRIYKQRESQLKTEFKRLLLRLNVPAFRINELLSGNEFSVIQQMVAGQSVPNPKVGANGFIYGVDGINMAATTKASNRGKNFTVPYSVKINGNEIVVAGIFTHRDKKKEGQVAIKCPIDNCGYKFVTKDEHLDRMKELDEDHAEQVFTSTSANLDVLNSYLWNERLDKKKDQKKGNLVYSGNAIQTLGNSVYRHYMTEHPGVLKLPEVASRANDCHHNMEMKMNADK